MGSPLCYQSDPVQSVFVKSVDQFFNDSGSNSLSSKGFIDGNILDIRITDAIADSPADADDFVFYTGNGIAVAAGNEQGDLIRIVNTVRPPIGHAVKIHDLANLLTCRCDQEGVMDRFGVVCIIYQNGFVLLIFFKMDIIPNVNPFPFRPGKGSGPGETLQATRLLFILAGFMLPFILIKSDVSDILISY